VVSASRTSLISMGVNNSSYLITDAEKSTDGGNYWTPITYPGAVSYYDVDDIAIDPTNALNVYALSNDTLRRSTNFGQSWATVDDSISVYPYSCTRIALSKAPSTVIYSAGYYGYIRKSTNSGTTWSSYRYSQTTDYSSSFCLTVDPANSNIVFVGRGDSLYKTTNGGVNWSVIAFAKTEIQKIAFDKSNSNNVYVTLTNGISKSTNGGSAWTNIYTNSAFEKIKTIVTLSNGSVLTGYYGQGIFLSTDGAKTFRSIGGNQIIPYGIQFQNTDNTLILWNSSGIYVSSNGGSNWRLSLADGSSSKLGLSINPTNANNWLVGTYGNLYSTINAGLTWSPGDVAAIEGATDIIHSKANSNYIVASNSDGIIRSTDRGASWKLLSPPIPGVSAKHIHLSPTDPNGLLAFANSYVAIVKSDDGGMVWSSFQEGITIPESGVSPSDIVFDPKNSNTLYLLLGSSVYSLSFPSTTWLKIYEPTEPLFRYPRELLMDPSNSSKMYSYYGEGILIGSTNGGSSWGNASSGLPDEYKTITRAFIGSTGKVFLATAAGLVSGFPTVSNVKKTNELPNTTALLQNFPNPFNPTTVIQYSLPYESNVIVTVYNTLGENVKTFNEQAKEAGFHNINFSGEEFPSGVYIYSIGAVSLDGKQSFRATKKMLLLR